MATSGLTVCLTATLSLWPSKEAEAIKHDADAPEAIHSAAAAPQGETSAAPESAIGATGATSLAPEDLFPDSTQAVPASPAQQPVAALQPVAPVTDWQKITVDPGENLSRIFKRMGLSATELFNFINSHKAAKALTNIQPGDKIEFDVDADKKLQALRYRPNRLEAHLFTRSQGGFDLQQDKLEPESKLVYRSATIKSSLFTAANQAGMDDNITMALADIFGWDIDFALNIRAGDNFKVLYEEQFLGDEKLANGPIMAAEFTNRGKVYQAVRYTNQDGVSQYFTPDGESMRKEFLRSPVDFARISSHFNLRRKHPVLNTIRAHKGTDYAAPRGTPIRAVGDGRVTFAGRNGGYGNVVKIQHGQTYQTRYAHLSKFHKKVRSNTLVKQGQIIGYVGSTGLATGPHLHFEFYVNGSVRNPVTVKLPKAKSVSKSERQHFAQQTQPLLVQLSAAGTSQLALNDSNSSNRE